ncbi:MAG: SMC-Scp complex subunit ScpB [Patescibacteria group bacterium]
MTLDAKIEAILFFKNEPTDIKDLANILDTSLERVHFALSDLEKKLEGRGLTLVHYENAVMLGTAKEGSELIEKIKKEELSRELGKAGLETLAIILYKGPIARATIDYIRGVNSSFILRSLMIRGLVDRVQNPNDSRGYLYKPTLELLSFMGLSKLEDLPEFNTMKEQVEKFTRDAMAEDQP